MRRMIAILAALMLLGTALTALAEEVPTQERAAVSISLGPKTNIYTLYSGPGQDYFIANGEENTVSHQVGQIFCYGYTVDGWLMVTQKDADGLRHTGWVYAPGATEKAADKIPLLSFGEKQVTLKSGTPLREGTGAASVMATVSGEAKLLMYFPDNVVYIEATVDGSGKKARGFIRRSDIDGNAAFNIPVYPGAAEYLTLAKTYPLNLPDDALAETMNVYPLSDGTFLIAYHCAGSDRLWMRVVSETGKKIFAKSVPELYLSQITLTKTGFICETFDNSEIDSGVRYTYICKGNKWNSVKIKYVDDPDRYYSENTKNFTLRRYPFGEGSVIPMEIECRTTNERVRHQMTYGSEVVLCEFEDFEYRNHLIVYAEDENGVMSARMYDTSGQLAGSAVSPLTTPVESAYGFMNAVWFYTDAGNQWERWRLDAATFTFAPEPLAILKPEECTLTVICGESSGDHLVLMDASYASVLCRVTSYGAVQLVCKLEGDAIWARHMDGKVLLLQQMEDGQFILQRYDISHG